MKVGILSMQKVRNYGSFLQAFALKKTVESFGNEVEFIDIIPGTRITEYKITLKRCFDWIVKHYFSLHAISRWRYAVVSKRLFELFFEELGVHKHTFDSYDVVVIGSDEVFNIAQTTSWGYSSQLFGNVLNAKKVISYAGSFGQTSFELIQSNRLTEDMTNALRNMAAISVRDENSREIVWNLLHTNPSINIDPVLLFDFSRDIRKIQEKNYILVYSYPNRIKDKNTIKSIKIFAQRNNKKIFSIGSFYEWADAVLLPHPFECLSYFRSADYVITDTYHGAVVSIKYNKQFAVLVNDSNKNKLEHLLKLLKVERQIVENYSNIDSVLSQKIDYADINVIIKNEIQMSLKYLRRNL